MARCHGPGPLVRPNFTLLTWAFVAELLKDHERIRASMNALIDQEREVGCRNTVEEMAVWAKR